MIPSSRCSPDGRKGKLLSSSFSKKDDNKVSVLEDWLTADIIGQHGESGCALVTHSKRVIKKCNFLTGDSYWLLFFHQSFQKITKWGLRHSVVN
jgi:hypothetical protein